MSRKSARHAKPGSRRSARNAPARHLAALYEANAHLNAGELDAAQEIYRSILRVDKADPEALLGCANVALMKSRPDDALKFADRILARQPRIGPAHAMRARALTALGRIDDAYRAAERALEIERNAENQCLLGDLYTDHGDVSCAVPLYLAALDKHPEDARIHNRLGIALRRMGRSWQALAHFDRALALDPVSIIARNNRANCLRALGDYDAAIEAYERALDLNPVNIDTLYNQALCNLQMGLAVEARITLDRIIAFAPDHEGAKIQLAECLINLGDFEHAKTILSDVTKSNPSCAHGWYLTAQICERDSDRGALLDILHERMANPQPSVQDQIELHFATAKLHDDLRQYDLAFTHFESANTLMRGSNDGLVDNLAACTATLLETRLDRCPTIEPPDDATPTPIFIFGMPRSGTTLVERLIGANAAIATCGEIDFFGPALNRIGHRHGLDDAPRLDTLREEECTELREAYIARVGRLTEPTRYFTDKTPGNYYYLGLLAHLFPAARFIHCVRHPLDVCLSNYFQLFDSVSFSYSLVDCASEYLRHEQLIRHWQTSFNLDIQTVSYEFVVENPNEVAKVLCDQCSLPTALRETPAVTQQTVSSMSRWQARQPIYTHAALRWKNYARHVVEVQRQLSSAIENYESSLNRH